MKECMKECMKDARKKHAIIFEMNPYNKEGVS